MGYIFIVLSIYWFSFDSMRIMQKRILTETDLDLIEQRLRDTFVTKEEFIEYKSQHFEKLDKIIKYTEDIKIRNYSNVRKTKQP
ncbi:hypothetical protein A2685_00760 [Candidatus Woesebacteria bacterium RIFCSPHIGHO2_01_FULL_37_10]|uniref:Uncharacterized protein n=1 Tax=Candidatus Woesebacteria bacterium RIFCSPHIGHO2_01_FULL_37_10 TaxID=1802489 RepID=A0A1F7XUT8_9BACT|nr:MAG: hypothetical protein A2685_00760 [Candidatus Woesebacteria bacterium RIFCSPHIGHO2_01_FULL_37_10]